MYQSVTDPNNLFLQMSIHPFCIIAHSVSNTPRHQSYEGTHTQGSLVFNMNMFGFSVHIHADKRALTHKVSSLMVLSSPSSSSPLSITLCTGHFIYAFQPWHVSSYLFCNRDLIKIMRNELFDQDLWTTRHRPSLDKSWPCLSASFISPASSWTSWFITLLLFLPSNLQL